VIDTATPEPRTPPTCQLAPPLLTLDLAAGDDRADRPALRATTVREFVVRAELDQAVTSSHERELSELLLGYQATICRTPNGRTEIQLLTPAHDVWQSILEAMVTLTNAGCAPTAIHVAQSDEPGQTQETTKLTV